MGQIITRFTIPYQKVSFHYKVILFSTYILIALLISIPYFFHFDWDAEPRSSLERLVDGTAHKPFMYRFLIPLIIKWILFITPLSTHFLAFLLVTLSLVGFVFAARYFANSFYQNSVFVDAISGLSVLFLFPLIFSGSKQIYDFSTLFLFTLGLAFLARGQIKRYLFLFPIACLNKETVLLLTLIYLLFYFQRIEMRFVFSNTLIQIVVFILIRLVLSYLFAGNPGGSFEAHWEKHIDALVEQPKATFNFAILSLLVLILIFWKWKDKPKFLRFAAVVLLPTLFLLYLLFGYPYEIRIFLELYPVVGLLSIQSLWSILRVEVPRAPNYLATATKKRVVI